MFNRSQCGSICVKGILSINISPSIGSYRRVISAPTVLFPLPLPPTSASDVPWSTWRSRLFKIGAYTLYFILIRIN